MRLLLRSRRALALDSVSVGSVPASPRAFHLALRDARVRIAPVVWSTRLKCPLRVETSEATRPCMSASLPKAHIRELASICPLSARSCREHLQHNACLPRADGRRAQTSPVGTIAAVSTIRMMVFSGARVLHVSKYLALRPFFSPYRQHRASAARFRTIPSRRGGTE